MSKELKEKCEDKSFFKIDQCTIADFCHKDDGRENIHFDPCELCKSVTLNPIDLDDPSRLLDVNVLLTNVCIGKELTVGCVIMNRAGTVLAFKAQTFTVRERGTYTTENSLVYDKEKCNCSNSPCTNTNRRFSFILPEGPLCSALDLRVKVIANYTHPC